MDILKGTKPPTPTCTCTKVLTQYKRSVYASLQTHIHRSKVQMYSCNRDGFYERYNMYIPVQNYTYIYTKSLRSKSKLSHVYTLT